MLGFCSLSELPISTIPYLEVLRSGKAVEFALSITTDITYELAVGSYIAKIVYI